MPNDHSDWERERPRLGDKRRKPWERMDAGEYVPAPETIQVKRRMTTEIALVTLRNGLPEHVPYVWNGAKRYRQMGIAISLFCVRQRIRRAQADMIETCRGAQSGN